MDKTRKGCTIIPRRDADGMPVCYYVGNKPIQQYDVFFTKNGVAVSRVNAGDFESALRTVKRAHEIWRKEKNTIIVK